MRARRPSDYNEELATEICARIMDGMSLVDIGRIEEMPTRQTIYRWMAKDAVFASRIARARDIQGDFVFDDIGEIERRLLAGEITSDVARVVIWSKQWRAAKLAQKRYGDRAELNVNTTLDVADRIIARWKENLDRLNRDEPLTIEGEKLPVIGGR